jgi:hypothetical protein
MATPADQLAHLLGQTQDFRLHGSLLSFRERLLRGPPVTIFILRHIVLLGPQPNLFSLERGSYIAAIVLSLFFPYCLECP